MVITRTTGRFDATSLASRSKTGHKITEYNRERERTQAPHLARCSPISRFHQDYKLIPTPGWPDYFLVGKILAYQLGEKLNESRLYRRGVIVESFESHSILLPIKTYGGRGCSHLKEEQKVHSAVYVGSRPPLTEQEPSLRVAIQASQLDVENSANPRINYNGKFNLSHTERVREVGQVSGRDLQVLLEQYQEVHGIAQEGTAAPLDFKPLPPAAELQDSGRQGSGDMNGANPARIQTSDLAAANSLAEVPQTPPQLRAIIFQTRKGKPNEEAVREAERQAEEHDRQIEEQNKREREERRARRAQAQKQPKA
ncbi:hypothetical protein BFW01_g1549 [Lasiodiplodia theobromae]|nr:hypothetical protein BFW01_g1549 [Lasiodiplodia theobromae]